MMFYDFKRGLSFQESHATLVATFGDIAPSKSSVHSWFKEFQRGRQTLEDESRPGRPPEVVTEKNTQLVKKLIDEKRNSTLQELEQASGIPATSVFRILHDQLGARKIASRWIPHLLTPEQKEQRVEWCHFMLEKFDRGRSKCVYDIVTGDETWICCYEPESKRQPTVWMFDDEPPPTKVVRSRSTKKQNGGGFLYKMRPLDGSSIGGRKDSNSRMVHHHLPPSSVRTASGKAAPSRSSRASRQCACSHSSQDHRLFVRYWCSTTQPPAVQSGFSSVRLLPVS